MRRNRLKRLRSINIGAVGKPSGNDLRMFREILLVIPGHNQYNSNT